MITSYTVTNEKYLAKARTAFCRFGEVNKIILNNTEFVPDQNDAALILIASNWEDVAAFCVTRIDGVCVLRVAMRRGGGNVSD